MKISLWRPSIIAAILPIFVQLIWLLHNTQLPVADADEQLSASFHVYKYAARHEWLSFLTELYHQRSYMWRPTGFYILQVPFQIVSGGNLMFTTIAITLLCTFVTCLYIYSLLCLALAPTSAILGTILLGLLPSVQWPATFLGFTECAFLPAVLASVYHLIRSNNLQEKWHSIYFVLAVVTAFTIRPVEALFHLALMFVIFIAFAWREKSITPDQLYRIAFGALVSASVLIISGIVNYKIEFLSPIFKDSAQAKFFTRIGWVIIISTIGLWVGKNIKQFSKWWQGGNRFSIVELSFFAIYILVVLFYLPFVPKLVEWIYMCSFGSLAALRNDRPPIHTLILGFILNSGAVPFLSITLVGITSFYFCLSHEQRVLLRKHKLLYLFSLIPITLFTTLYSVQFLQRKVTVIIDVFLLALLIPGLMRGPFWQLRSVLLVMVAVGQLYGTMSIAAEKPQKDWLKLFTGGGYPLMLSMSPNPNMVLFEFLENTAQHNGYKSILLPISTTSVIVDPFLLSMLIENLDNGIHVGFPYKPSYNSETLSNFLHGDENAFLLINDTKGQFVQSPEEVIRLHKLSAADADPNDKLMYDLQAIYAENKFKELRVTKKECMIIPGLNQEACIFELEKVAP